MNLNRREIEFAIGTGYSDTDECFNPEDLRSLRMEATSEAGSSPQNEAVKRIRSKSPDGYGARHHKTRHIAGNLGYDGAQYNRLVIGERVFVPRLIRLLKTHKDLPTYVPQVNADGDILYAQPGRKHAATAEQLREFMSMQQPRVTVRRRQAR